MKSGEFFYSIYNNGVYKLLDQNFESILSSNSKPSFFCGLVIFNEIPNSLVTVYTLKDIKSNLNLSTSIVDFRIEKDYFYCSDSLGNCFYYNINGDKYFEFKTGSLENATPFKESKRLGLSHDLVRYRKNTGMYIIVSNGNKVIYSSQLYPYNHFDNTFLLRKEKSNSRAKQIAIYDDQLDAIFIQNGTDIRMINSDVYLIKNEHKWKVKNKAGKDLLNQYFNKVTINKIPNSDKKILTLIRDDIRYYYDENLKKIEFSNYKDLKFMRIKSIYSEVYDDSLFSFVQVFDLESKKIIGLLDDNFEIIKKSNLKYVSYNAVGEYFFIENLDGSFEYIRVDDFK